MGALSTIAATHRWPQRQFRRTYCGVVSQAKPASGATAITDEEVRRVVEKDCCEFLAAAWDCIACRILLPGTPDAMIRAQRKASQMGRAQALGFDVPATAFGNDPREFLDLYREQSGRLISKIMASLVLRSRFGTEFMRSPTPSRRVTWRMPPTWR